MRIIEKTEPKGGQRTGQGKFRTSWPQTRWTLAALLMLAVFPNTAIAEGNQFDFEHVSCSGAENEIKVVIEGVKKSVGLLTADLYPNKQDGFLKGGGRLTQVKYAAKAPITQFCIKAPMSGDFAITVYHDRNANGRFDKTGLGMPNEPWGISNNPKVRFAAPPVTKALFAVTQEGAQLKIQLR